MNYKTFIETALSPVSPPVSFSDYTGTANPYITYFCYNEQGELYAEGEEIATGYYIQVDIWSKSKEYEALATQVKTLLIAAGFNREYACDLYESGTKIFHKVMRFNFVEEMEI